MATVVRRRYTSAITNVSFESMQATQEGPVSQRTFELLAFHAAYAYLPGISHADLALFVVVNDYNVLASIRHCSNFFMMRHYSPELFYTRAEVRGLALEGQFKNKAWCNLDIAERTAKEEKIILIRLLDFDAQRYDFAEAVKNLNLVLDVSQWENGPDNKFVFVIDLHGTTMAHRQRLSWMALRKFFVYVQRGSPMRLQSVHFVNSQGDAADAGFHDWIKDNIINNPELVDALVLQYHDSIESMCSDLGINQMLLPLELDGLAGELKVMLREQAWRYEYQQAFIENMEGRMRLRSLDNTPTLVELFGEERDFPA